MKNNLKKKEFLFFDVTEYETIIQYYVDHLQFGKGLKAAKQAHEQFPFSPEIGILTAQCYIGKEQFDEALKVIEKAENLNPNDLDLQTVKGNILSVAGNFEEAVQVLLGTLDLAEDKSEVYYNVGLTLPNAW